MYFAYVSVTDPCVKYCNMFIFQTKYATLPSDFPSYNVDCDSESNKAVIKKKLNATAVIEINVWLKQTPTFNG
jgi:hypothetical protein